MSLFDYSQHKIFVLGIQESGKTHFVKKEIIPAFKKPIVFEINKDDNWDKEKRIFVYQAWRDVNTHDVDGLKKQFAKWVKQCLEWAEEGKIDCIIIDEADMFLKNKYDIPPALYYLITNHRHVNNGKGVALVFVTRRPQDIPPVIGETSKFTVCFQIEGKNAIDRLNNLSVGLGDTVRGLRPREFVVKELGKEPEKFMPLKE